LTNNRVKRIEGLESPGTCWGADGLTDKPNA
jgi:hypothetical protein